MSWNSSIKCVLSVLIPTALVGCGTLEPVNFDGKSLTYLHGSLGFERAMKAAQEKCGSIGKTVKHVSTSGRAEFISTFECTENR
jgi:hypothetical protein